MRIGSDGAMVVMQRTNIYLEADQLRALKHLAAEQDQSVADLVRQAVDDYLAEHIRDDHAWAARLDDLVERVRKRTTDSVPPEQIEADISAARAEARETHRAARRR